ncbi:hypothetical protein MJO28_009886 [Puccinia striiformis f. sp. tritici]|uniref:Uncharacterized protein n=3 Tax=Puccinia striiformis TaxID=27350 RepID=A0A2S4UVG1_9BASI|nr:hypothetical protein MJO28_009886 [Puccinia striiformis f. sp. tritici]POW01230.1 hypothetical protein PSHT_12621 [Puccinia striiformis]POW04354.1 hypothetical protein PSTT_10443 [Puccinia striiformis]
MYPTLYRTWSLSPSKHAQAWKYIFGFMLTLLATSMLVIYRVREPINSAPQRHILLEATNSPSPDISSSQTSTDPTLDYRRFLELTTSPKNFNQHHPTLGFGHIYCISLPNRKDRRETMTKISAALGVKITFIDAISKDHPVIGWIGERASEVRKKKLELMSQYSGLEKEKIGGMGAGSVWLTVNNGRNANQDSLRNIKLPSLAGAQPEFEGKNWVDYLWSVSDHHTLTSSNPDFNITAEMWDPQEKMLPRQINAATVSTYYNHLRVLRTVSESGEASALILEDDVDMEWDLERRWRSIERHLPSDWDTVFLGHCWGHELIQPQFGHPNLHKSTEPLCLHGYAVSSLGSKKLVELYSDPWTSFQTPVDTCIPTFIKLGLNSFSVEPTIINQSKVLESDIQSGKGSNWKGLLVDSVAQRILKSEGKTMNESLNQNDSKSNPDPATLFRYKSVFTKALKDVQCTKDV